MNDLDRLKQLFGQNPNHEQVAQLSKELKQISEAYSAAIEAVKAGKQIDEGLFTNLIAAAKTAQALSSGGTKKIADAVKKVSAQVKTLYLDAKAQQELKIMVKEMAMLVVKFDELTKKSPTIMKRDPEVNKEMVYFQKLFMALITTLQSRLAIKEGLTTAAEIEAFLFEEGYVDTLTEAKKLDSEEMKQVYDSAEYKEAVKVMKDVTTNKQRKEGTLMFDTGIETIYFNPTEWSEDSNGTKCRYVFKIYADGQIRGELRGGPNFIAVGSSHYRLGKPLKGDTPVEIYKKGLADIVKRFHKKTARLASEQSQLRDLTMKYQADVARLMLDKDAVEDTVKD